MQKPTLNWRGIWNVLHSFETKRISRQEAIDQLQVLGLGIIRSKYLVIITEQDGYSPTRHFAFAYPKG